MNLPLSQIKWFTLLWGFILVACTTVDDPPIPGSGTAGLVLSKVVLAGHDTTTYEYDAQKKLVKAWFPANLIINNRHYKELMYDAQGKIVKSNFKLQNGNVYSCQTYTYTNRVLTKVSFYNRSDSSEDFIHEYDQMLEYNAHNQIVKLITRKPTQPDWNYRFTNFTYNAAGDVITLTDYVNQESGPVNDYTAVYTYDDKNNPYQNATLFGIGAFTLSSHNITTVKETYPLSGQVKNTVYAYSYNRAGLPIQEIRTSDSKTFQSQNFYQAL